jgi:hypothetical protein
MYVIIYYCIKNAKLYGAPEIVQCLFNTYLKNLNGSKKNVTVILATGVTRRI